MKKIIALLLALITALSLCACGGGDDKKESSTKPDARATEPGATRKPEDIPEILVPLISQEEMLASAEAFDYYKLMDLEGIVEKECIGHFYTTTGYITSLSGSSITLVPLDGFLTEEMKPRFYVELQLTEDVVAQLHENQVIQIVGQLNEMIGNTLFMEHGYYLGDVIDLAGSVYFSFDPISGQKVMPIAINTDLGNYPSRYVFKYYFDATPEFESTNVLDICGVQVANETSLHGTARMDLITREYSSSPAETKVSYHLLITELLTLTVD